MFFALWPKPAVQRLLAETTQDVVRAAGGRPMPLESFHVTLAFLGSVPEERVSEVKAIAQEVATEVAFTSVEVSFDVIEYWKKAGVICATVRADSSAGGTPAETLASALKSHLTAAGFAPDLKPFRAHITLARNVSHRIPTGDLPPVLWSFAAFALVESKTDPQGAVYRVLEFFPLGAAGRSSPRR